MYKSVESTWHFVYRSNRTVFNRISKQRHCCYLSFIICAENRLRSFHKFHEKSELTRHPISLGVPQRTFHLLRASFTAFMYALIPIFPALLEDNSRLHPLNLKTKTRIEIAFASSLDCCSAYVWPYQHVCVRGCTTHILVCKYSPMERGRNKTATDTAFIITELSNLCWFCNGMAC